LFLYTDIVKGIYLDATKNTYLPDLPMVALSGLGEESFVFRQLFFVREGYAVYPLQGVVVLVTEEVRSRVLRGLVSNRATSRVIR